jgi:hypothetical protein
MSHQIHRHDSYDSSSLTWLPVKLLLWVGCGHTFCNCQPWGTKILPAHNLGNLFSGISNLVNSETEALRECQMYILWCNVGQFLLKLWFRMSWATNTIRTARMSKAEQASSSVTMRQWHHVLNGQQSGNKKYCLYIAHQVWSRIQPACQLTSVQLIFLCCSLIQSVNIIMSLSKAVVVGTAIPIQGWTGP